MHPIERFGLISLLILTGSVTAFALYEGQPDPAETKLAAKKAERGATEREAEARRQQFERQKENERRERAAELAREALAAKEQRAASHKQADSLTSLSGRGTTERPHNAGVALAADGDSKGSSQSRRWSEKPPAEPGFNPERTQRDQLSTPRRTVRDPEADLAARDEQARKTLPQASAAERGLGLETSAPNPRAAKPSAGGTQGSSDSKRTGAPAGTREYVVAKGEVTSQISQRELGSVKHQPLIQELNPKLDLDHIEAGEVILLPLDVPSKAVPKGAIKAQPAVAAQKSSSSAPAGGYRVAEGESLWSIAQRELGDGNLWKQIAELNPKLDPHRLEPGALLTLPKGNGTTEVAQQRSGSGSVVSKVR